MEAFDYAKPKTLSEALQLAEEANGDALLLAGGTDVIVQLREGRKSCKLLIDIKAIDEVNEISCNGEGLTLGSAVPAYLIKSNKDICAGYPGLIDAIALIGGTQIQGRASVGGNICNSSPAADTTPALIAHRATCVIAGPNGTREVAAQDFCVSPGKNVLQKGEILLSIKVPPQPANGGAHYLRFIPRNEMDIAVVGVGACIELDKSGKNFVSGRFAVGAVAPTPLFVPEAGEALAGQPVNDETIEKVCAATKAAAKPITDMRGSAAQRIHLTGVLTKRAINKALERARQ
ncbi:MAG: xanthine dehydrogenase family protein subunit M [Planctomycetota bacterium]|nr:xanthine dehydrogenase family protein subunit M [Planctomycetota bacterium]MDA1137848.1 xanthine dehydrogenase family protein subunit M [Planctomycetota bacterium]